MTDIENTDDENQIKRHPLPRVQQERKDGKASKATFQGKKKKKRTRV